MNIKRIIKSISRILIATIIISSGFYLYFDYHQKVWMREDVNRLLRELDGCREMRYNISDRLSSATKSLRGLEFGVCEIIKNQISLAQAVLFFANNIDFKPDFKYLMLTTAQIKSGRAGGAGSIVREDEEYLYILTAKHVLTAGKPHRVLLKDVHGENHFFDVHIKDLWIDENYDIGFVRIKKVDDTKFEILNVSSDLPTIGEKIYTIGHPINVHYTVNTGIVSNYVKCSYHSELLNLMMISAPAFSGNSGGAVINCNNELVGVVVGIRYVITKRNTPFYLTHMVLSIRVDTINKFIENAFSCELEESDFDDLEDDGSVQNFGPKPKEVR